MSNSSIWPIDRILSGTTTLSQSEPGSDNNKGVLCIPQSSSITSSITGALPSDCLVSYPGHLLVVGSYLSAEMQSVYSTAPVDWGEAWWGEIINCNHLLMAIVNLCKYKNFRTALFYPVLGSQMLIFKARAEKSFILYFLILV